MKYALVGCLMTVWVVMAEVYIPLVGLRRAAYTAMGVLGDMIFWGIGGL